MKRVAGYAVMAFFLIVASDFATTATIAVAFAWLIFFSVLLVAGPAAFVNLQNVYAGK